MVLVYIHVLNVSFSVVSSELRNCVSGDSRKLSPLFLRLLLFSFDLKLSFDLLVITVILRE